MPVNNTNGPESLKGCEGGWERWTEWNKRSLMEAYGNTGFYFVRTPPP